MSGRPAPRLARLLRRIGRHPRAGSGAMSLFVAAVAAGVAPLVAVQVINDSVVSGVHETVDGLAGPAPLEVWFGLGDLAFPEPALRLVGLQKGVSAALPVVRGTVGVADDADATVELVGVDLVRTRLPRHRGDVGPWSSDPHSIVLAAALAKRHAVDVGGSISLAGARGIERFTVRGVLEPEGLGRAYGERVAVMHFPAAQAVLGKQDRVDQIDVFVHPDADVEAVRGRLATSLPQTFTVGRPYERAALLEAAFRTVRAVLTLLGLVALATGILLAAGVAGATGAPRRTRAEAVTLAGLGTGLGILGGIALARFSVGPLSGAMATVCQLPLAAARLSFDPRRFGAIAVVAIAAALASSLAARGVGRRGPRRAAGIAVAPIALVTAVGVALASFLLSGRESLSTYYDEGGILRADLVVSAVAAGAGWLETPLPAAIAAELEAIPGVSAVDTVRVLPGQLHEGRRITVLGLSDGLLDPSRHGPREYVAGDDGRGAAALRAGRGASVGAHLAERLGVRVGDSIALATPAGRLKLPVVGVVRDPVLGAGVVVNRRLVVTFWDEPTVQRFGVLLRDDVSVEGVRAEIARRLGDRYRLKILPPDGVIEHQSDALGRAFTFTHGLELVVVVATFIAFRAVHRAPRTSAAALGGLGALLGVAVGLAAAWVAVRSSGLEWHPALIAAAWYVTLVVATAALPGTGLVRA